MGTNTQPRVVDSDEWDWLETLCQMASFLLVVFAMIRAGLNRPHHHVRC